MSWEASAPTIHTVEESGRVLGYIVIDSTVCGRARGGLRMVADVQLDEIRAAAHAMTLKYGLLGLPQGGAKAGIIGDGESPPQQKRAQLRAFASAALPILRDRRYIPDADLGTSAEDIRAMMEEVGMPTGARDWRDNRSGHYTARSCLAVLETVLESNGRKLAAQRVAIEGFGAVGSALARLLSDRGVKVVAVSTSEGALYCPDGLNVQELLVAVREHGSRFVLNAVIDRSERLHRSQLLELAVDVLFPCARHHSITAANVGRVQAPIICAGANAPLSLEAETTLLARGTIYPPDFVSNCGGVLGGTLEFASVAPAKIEALIDEKLQRQMRKLLQQAAAQGRPLRMIAEQVALERHAETRRTAEGSSLPGMIMRAGVEAYRRRWVPARLVAAVAARSVGRAL